MNLMGLLCEDVVSKLLVFNYGNSNLESTETIDYLEENHQ